MPFAGYKDFDDCVLKNQDKGDPKAYCATIMRKVEKSEAVIELKDGSMFSTIDPRAETPVRDDAGQSNIIDYSNQEPLLFALGENSSHEYPGKIVISNESRYVDREVKRSFIPNVAETGAEIELNDMTQPTLPTGAPQPTSPAHGYNINNQPIELKDVPKGAGLQKGQTEAVSIPAGLVDRDVGINYDDPKKHKFLEEDPGSDEECQHCGAPKKEHTGDFSEGEYSYKEMKEALIKADIKKFMEAIFNEEQHPRDPPGSSTGGQFTGGEKAITSPKEIQLKLNTKRINLIKDSHLQSQATNPMVDAGGYFEGALPSQDSFAKHQTENDYYDMKEAIENGDYKKSDAMFLKAMKKEPKAFEQFTELSEELEGFNEAMKEKTKNAKELYRFTDTGELDSYLEKDSTFGASHYSVGKNADYKCFTLEPFNKFFRDGAEVLITTPTDSFKDNMQSAEYSSFPRSESYVNKKASDNEKSGRYALETEVRVKADTKVPVGKLKIEFRDYMSFDSVDKFKEKYSSLGELTFPNASRDYIDK